MEKVNIPKQKATEPNEEARQPQTQDESMTPKLSSSQHSKKLTFAEDILPPSQKSGSYQDVLSQPAPGMSQRARLGWLQRRHTRGLWAQCDDCSRWRYVPTALDSHDLPRRWYCHMNTDKAFAECSVPEAPLRVRDEEDLIHNEYSAGSVVWARLAGWPWWPALVDDCPDTELFYWLDGFSDIPTHYNVTFFDSNDVTRAWIEPSDLKPYNKKSFKPVLNNVVLKPRLRAAKKQADEACRLDLKDRLEKYSFLARYKGNINTPKDACYDDDTPNTCIPGTESQDTELTTQTESAAVPRTTKDIQDQDRASPISVGSDDFEY